MGKDLGSNSWHIGIIRLSMPNGARHQMGDRETMIRRSRFQPQARKLDVPDSHVSSNADDSTPTRDRGPQQHEEPEALSDVWMMGRREPEQLLKQLEGHNDVRSLHRNG
jgi:hypothetical protein